MPSPGPRTTDHPPVALGERVEDRGASRRSSRRRRRRARGRARSGGGSTSPPRGRSRRSVPDREEDGDARHRYGRLPEPARARRRAGAPRRRAAPRARSPEPARGLRPLSERTRGTAPVSAQQPLRGEEVPARPEARDLRRGTPARRRSPRRNASRAWTFERCTSMAGQRHRLQAVVERDARVREGAGVDDDAARLLPVLVEEVEDAAPSWFDWKAFTSTSQPAQVCRTISLHVGEGVCGRTSPARARRAGSGWGRSRAGSWRLPDLLHRRAHRAPGSPRRPTPPASEAPRPRGSTQRRPAAVRFLS